MTLHFACGHAAPFSEKRGGVCHCGDRRVVAVEGDRPQFIGTATGPHVTTQALEPIAVNLAPKGTLRLKSASAPAARSEES